MDNRALNEMIKQAMLNKMKQDAQKRNEAMNSKLAEKQSDANKTMEKHMEELNYIKQNQCSVLHYMLNPILHQKLS